MKFFQLIPTTTNFDFIGKFKIWSAISALTCAGAIFFMATKGFNFGIDFTGGTVIQVQYLNPIDAAEVRKTFTDLGEPDASVSALGKEGKEYLITVRTPVVEGKEVEGLERKFINKVGSDKAKILSVEKVGPKVGQELRNAALWSLLYSIILITIYIWFRFDVRFAPGATIAMVHDIILAAGFYAITGNEFTITAVAALLTIAGYSVNDTIVIYDRVREMMKHGDGTPVGSILNRAINLTLSRTMLTSGVTLISIIPIMIFCSGEVKDFAVAIGVGIFVGTYSTVYVAAPFTIYVERFLAGSSQKRGKTARAV